MWLQCDKPVMKIVHERYALFSPDPQYLFRCNVIVLLEICDLAFHIEQSAAELKTDFYFPKVKIYCFWEIE